MSVAGLIAVSLAIVAFLGCSSSSTGPSKNDTPTLPEAIAYFSFSGNADDESGNGNDATVYGATLTTDRFGNADDAYSFDGVDDYIQTPIDSNTLPISFSVWFKASSVSNDRSMVDSDVWNQSGHSLIIGWWNYDGDLHIEYHNSSIDSDFPVSVDTWYHAVVCFSDSIWLYVDGVQVGPAHEYPVVTLDGDSFRFGRHNAADPQWYAGVIDDVRFFDEVLTADDVHELYTEGGWPDK